MKKRWYRLCAVLIFLAGAAMLAYPVLSNYSYEQAQKRLADRYANVVTTQNDSDTLSRHREECDKYNRELLEYGIVHTDPFNDTQLDPDTMPYAGLLNFLGDGVMGSLEYPGLIDPLMIYHGTRESSLQKGIGHLQGTSLPVGGPGTHCVLSAHSGLFGKKLFTNLDRAKIGDVFYLHVLDQDLAYRVDSVNVVLPSDTESLSIDPDCDYVTLITCTPYGINSHRLLVRGSRIPLHEASEVDSGQQARVGRWTTEYIKAILIGLAISAALLLCGFLIRRFFRKRRKNKGGGE